MSSRIGTYFSIASIGTFDYALGRCIALGTDYVFPAPSDQESILKMCLLSVGQLTFAMFLAFELRGMLLTERKGFFDPTGGMCFILGIRKMPNFSQRITNLTTKIMDFIFNPKKNEPTTDGAAGPLTQQTLNSQLGQSSSAPTNAPTDIIARVKNAQSRPAQ